MLARDTLESLFWFSALNGSLVKLWDQTGTFLALNVAQGHVGKIIQNQQESNVNLMQIFKLGLLFGIGDDLNIEKSNARRKRLFVALKKFHTRNSFRQISCNVD